MRTSIRLTLPAAAVLLVAACTFGSVILQPEGPDPRPRPESTMLPEVPPDGQARIIDMTGQPTLRKYYRPYRVEFGINVPQYVFDANNDGQLDPLASIEKKFTARVPAGFTGVVALDWEHPVFEWIDKDPGSREFQRAVGGFKQLLERAKRLRPRAEIGFFGLPKTPYWKRDANWRERSFALAGLLQRADWIGPKVYHPYKTGQMTTVDDDKQRTYVVDSVQIGLEVARKAGGKPVYMWVTHRYSPGNEQHGMRPVDETEFVDTLRLIMETKHEGRGVDGVIWWAGDSWYAKQGRMPPGEAGRGRIEHLHDHYFELLASVLRPAGP